MYVSIQGHFNLHVSCFRDQTFDSSCRYVDKSIIYYVCILISTYREEYLRSQLIYAILNKDTGPRPPWGLRVIKCLHNLVHTSCDCDMWPFLFATYLLSIFSLLNQVHHVQFRHVINWFEKFLLLQDDSHDCSFCCLIPTYPIYNSLWQAIDLLWIYQLFHMICLKC